MTPSPLSPLQNIDRVTVTSSTHIPKNASLCSTPATGASSNARLSANPPTPPHCLEGCVRKEQTLKWHRGIISPFVAWSCCIHHAIHPTPTIVSAVSWAISSPPHSSSSTLPTFFLRPARSSKIESRLTKLIGRLIGRRRLPAEQRQSWTSKAAWCRASLLDRL